MLKNLTILVQIIHHLLNRNQVCWKKKMITEVGTRVFKGVKIIAPLKYLSNFWDI